MRDSITKLVFVGGVGAGKTTAIRAISDHAPVNTEMPLSDGAVGEKTQTTVALDYSTVELDDGDLLHVYGVPGQQYLDFMWPLVCEGALGVVVLVEPNSEITNISASLLREFVRIVPDACFVVGVTKLDQYPSFRLADLRDGLLKLGFSVPVVRLDARVTSQVEFLVKVLLTARYALDLGDDSSPAP